MLKGGRLVDKFLKVFGPKPARKPRLIDKNGDLTSQVQLFQSRCSVGTFHKTGTVLMASLLRRLNRHANFGVWNLARNESQPARWQVAFDPHSRFANDTVDFRSIPCAVVVRDPRDVIISAAHYHMRSKELWLHNPSDKFDGRTYQQKINSLPDMASRFRFEMHNTAGRTIESMLRVRAADEHANTMFVKLENLVADVELVHFQMLFGHLGLDPAYMPFALQTAWNCSLFSNTTATRKHARGGPPEQWKTAFDAALNGEFATLFPGAAEQLGYCKVPK